MFSSGFQPLGQHMLPEKNFTGSPVINIHAFLKALQLHILHWAAHNCLPNKTMLGFVMLAVDKQI